MPAVIALQQNSCTLSSGQDRATKRFAGAGAESVFGLERDEVAGGGLKCAVRSCAVRTDP
jgi:hypothetical protein